MDEWYRDSDWSPAARQEFERRLAKARVASRPQYLRIKAASLLEAGDLAAADSLMRRILDEYPGSLDAGYAQEFGATSPPNKGDWPTPQSTIAVRSRSPRI